MNQQVDIRKEEDFIIRLQQRFTLLIHHIIKIHLIADTNKVLIHINNKE